MLKPYLARVTAREDLSVQEARVAIEIIMRGDASPEQISGFLIALRMKGETVDEITGCAEAMRAAANRVKLGPEPLLDTCGTGGDGANTFNVSTVAAFVAAGAGARVAKHGNRSVSSSCGSADVLEYLGVTLTSDPLILRRSLDEAGLAFLFAPNQHPAMKHAVGPRRELGLRTVFNVLGPLTNPAGASRQLVGVYDGRLVEQLANVLGKLGAERALVVHGAGGLDEISLLGSTDMAEWDGSGIRQQRISPEDLGFEVVESEAIRGGGVAQSAALLRSILGGESGPATDIVLLNAGAALYVGGLADSIAMGIERARASITSGAAARSLTILVEVTSS